MQEFWVTIEDSGSPYWHIFIAENEESAILQAKVFAKTVGGFAILETITTKKPN